MKKLMSLMLILVLVLSMVSGVFADAGTVEIAAEVQATTISIDMPVTVNTSWDPNTITSTGDLLVIKNLTTAPVKVSYLGVQVAAIESWQPTLMHYYYVDRYGGKAKNLTELGAYLTMSVASNLGQLHAVGDMGDFDTSVVGVAEVSASGLLINNITDNIYMDNADGVSANLTTTAFSIGVLKGDDTGGVTPYRFEMAPTLEAGTSFASLITTKLELKFLFELY